MAASKEKDTNTAVVAGPGGETVFVLSQMLNAIKRVSKTEHLQSKEKVKESVPSKVVRFSITVKCF